MKSKGLFFYLMAGLLVVSFFLILNDNRTKVLLLQKYQASEEATELLKNTNTFRLYLNVYEKEPLISPADLFFALKDFAAASEKESELIIPLARVRHLLGGSYPTDFAVALARLEKNLPEAKVESASSKPFQTEQEKEFVKDIMPLAVFAYLEPDKIKNDKYKVIDYASSENGFSATAFEGKDAHIIIAFRGSDETKDLIDAERILEGRMPDQFDNALKFYQKLRQEYPNAKIRATGHSLGGSLAQLLAAHTDDVLALTCNPVGTKQLIKRDFDAEKIMNLTVQNDKFSFALPQAGHTLVLRPDKTDAYGDPLHPHSVLNCMPE